MEVKKEEVISITLTLDGKEAAWLKAVMQNPLYDCTPDEEDGNDSEMRYKLWNALDVYN